MTCSQHGVPPKPVSARGTQCFSNLKMWTLDNRTSTRDCRGESKVLAEQHASEDVPLNLTTETETAK